MTRLARDIVGESEGTWLPLVPDETTAGGGRLLLFCSSSGERLRSSSFRLADVASRWASIASADVGAGAGAGAGDGCAVVVGAGGG